jgi:hypothetical protein
MVSRRLWSDQVPAKVQRSRTRDLSRQFRGEKAIEWRVVEIYVELLFAADDADRDTEFTLLRELHVQAFGVVVDRADTPTPEPVTAPIDPVYVAELERQLEQARTRASFATALLVIVQAENKALRGRGESFGWFVERPRPDAAGKHTIASRKTAAPAALSAASPGPGTGRRQPGPRPDTDGSRQVDAVTAPIRRLSDRAGQRRRASSNRPALADAFPAGSRMLPPAAPSAAFPAPASLTRIHAASSTPAPRPAPDPLADHSGLDILVSQERRRPGKKR